LEEYKEVLIQAFEYPPFLAEQVAGKLAGLNDELQNYFRSYYQEIPLEHDIICQDYSIKILMDSYGMKFPAAVLFMDSLQQNYDESVKMLKYGRK